VLSLVYVVLEAHDAESLKLYTFSVTTYSTGTVICTWAWEVYRADRASALIAWKIWRIHSASIPADTGRAEKTLMVKLMVKPSKIALLIATQAFLGVITESYALQT
jgi:hypothetical protein